MLLKLLFRSIFMIFITLSCYFSSKYIYLIYFSNSNIQKQSIVNIEKDNLSYEDKNEDIDDAADIPCKEQNEISNVQEENINNKEENESNIVNKLEKNNLVESYTKTEHIVENKASNIDKENKDRVFRLIEEFLERNPQCVEKIIKRYLSKSGIYNE